MNKELAMSYEQLKERLESIGIEEHRCFLLTTYACMARVGEIVRGKYKPNPPIETKDFSTREIDGKSLLTIYLLTEKTLIPRLVPLNREKEAWLTEPILSYALKKDGVVFPYSTRWGQYTFQKYFPEYNQHIHLLRGWRATHYRQKKITGELLDWGVISKMGGWKNSITPQAHYDHSVIEDYIDLL